MDRLIELWDLREKSTKNDGQYHDRVTEMLQVAMNAVGETYIDQLQEHDKKMADLRKQAEQIARDNNERTWQREHQEIYEH